MLSRLLLKVRVACAGVRLLQRVRFDGLFLMYYVFYIAVIDILSLVINVVNVITRKYMQSCDQKK